MKYLLLFALLALATAGLTGTYRNQLGSTMSLIATGGNLTGWYETPVGDAAGKYPLHGSYKSESGPSTITFSVIWSNSQHGDSHSATSWTGYILPTSNTIHTTWILVSEQTDEKQAWSAFRVGQDKFEKTSHQ